MVTAIPQVNLANARRYFREHLRVGDYYAAGAAIEGEWFGQAAERLRLKGPVEEKDFLALCAGLNPSTGGPLTARRNTTRQADGIRKANRRVFYDFVYRPPKSVSILALLEDERIIGLHRKAVQVSLAALERYAETRVRLDGACTDRRTGNIVAALFEHDTSREQDPLLHTHAVLFNATWDPTEQRWKALQTAELFKAMAYADAVYNTEMTRELVRLGYDVERAGHAWEITGVPREMIRLLSKRRNHIERRLLEELAKPANAGLDPHVVRERIAREERKRKIRGADRKSLLKKWRAEIGPDGVKLLARLHPTSGRTALPKPDYRAAVEWGKAFVFERKSVVRLHELLAAAARRLLGTDASMEKLRAAAWQSGLVREEDGERIASVEGLRREWSIVERAKSQRSRHRPFVRSADLARHRLDAEQARAVATLLGSRDGITLFRGAAGTGKTFTLRALVAELERAGHAVRVTTPQARQVRALADEHLTAVTLARLLQQAELPVGGVVVLDEAGQVGGRQMEELFDLARRHACRLIISGDTRQHSSVEASDAMRSLEAFAAVTTAEIKFIRRQDPARAATPEERAQIALYRSAVEAASEGQPEAALARLSSAGFVHETDAIIEDTAREFDRLHAEGLEVLAVSQTREFVHELNRAITDRLAARSEVRDVRPIEAFVPRDTTAAEKRVPEGYAVGTVLRLVQNYSTLRRGNLATVVSVERHALMLDVGDGRMRRASLRHAARWQILERTELPVGIGSTLQLRANLTGPSKLTNGERVTVTDFANDGALAVEDRFGNRHMISRADRIFQLGYAVTSYGSQGQTVDAVLLADAGVAAASHRKEWYVSISRARRKIAVFTDTIDGLARRISAPGDRLLGIELLPEIATLVRHGVRSLVHNALRRAQRAVTSLHS